MNNKNSTIAGSSLNLQNFSNLRSGERVRRQLFQLNTDRFNPLCKGEENDYNIQMEYES